MKRFFYCSLVTAILSFGYCAECGAKGSPSTAPSTTTSNPSPASGTTTTPPATPQQPSPSTASFESQLLAFRTVDSIAKTIASQVSAHGPSCNTSNASSTSDDNSVVSIIIYDPTTFANILAYGAFVQNANAMVSSYETFLTAAEIKALPHDLSTLTGRAASPTFGGSPAGASTSTSFSFSPISDLTGLVSSLAVSSNSETYGSVVIPDSAVAIAVTGHLNEMKCKNYRIVYPPMFGQGSTSNQAGQDIQEAIIGVQVARRAAHEAVINKLASYTKDQLTTTYPGTVIAAGLADIDQLYDGFMNSLLTPNANGVLGSAAIVQGHELANLLDGPDGKGTTSYVLVATILAAGGTTHDQQTFWTKLSSGDKITYSGGAVVGVALWQASEDATPAYAALIPFRVPLTDEKDINGK